MAIYYLDETPTTFITLQHFDNEFVYEMRQIESEVKWNTIRFVDLRSDKLIIYGVELQESMLERLYECLVLRPKAGVIFVNCDGACYFLVHGHGCYRPIQNVIFDWSSFGITIPNSIDDSLRKQLDSHEKKMGDMSNQLLCAEGDLKASREEVEELKEQLVVCTKKEQDAQEKLQKACVELENYKIQLESSKKELQKAEEQLSLAKQELQCTKIQLESSEKRESDHLWSIISEIKSTNEKLDQLLSIGLDRSHHSHNKLQYKESGDQCSLLSVDQEFQTSIYNCPVVEELSSSFNEVHILTTKEGDHMLLSKEDGK